MVVHIDVEANDDKKDWANVQIFCDEEVTGGKKVTSVRRVAKEGMVSSSQAPAAGSSQCCLALERKQASIS